MKTGLSSLAGIGLLLLNACGRHADQAADPQKLPTAFVQTQTIESRKRLATEEVVGTVRAKLRASLEAKVSGRIEKMPVALSQIVKENELLAQLDVREIQARLDQTLAQRNQAERELQRFATLFQQKAVTQQEYDAVEARQRIAQAAVAEAETMLGYARIAAPFAGVITRKLADVGDLASPGRPLLELEDPTTLRFEADVPEAFLDRIHLGATLTVRMTSLTNEVDGVVSEIAPASDPNSRTFRVKLDLPKSPAWRAGQFGRVAVPLAETTALRVPETAVLRRGQMEIVFLVVNQRAQMRLVRTGKRVGREIELVSGVSAGERVVVAGTADLVEGQPVQVKP